MDTRRRRALYWLALFGSVLSTLYCYSGVIMNAHLWMMGSEAQAAGRMLAAKIFAWLTFIGLFWNVFFVVVLWRTRPARSAHQKALTVLALVALLVACKESRVPVRSAADSVVFTSAALPAAEDDDGCAADSARVHPAPLPLLNEYLERDGRGELLSTEPWHASAVECPGHTPGFDEATVVAGWQVTPLKQDVDTARYVVAFQRLARLTQDSVGPYIVADTGLEHDTVIVVRKPYGWRIGGFELDPHIRPATARAQLRDSARGAALLDSLATVRATSRAPGV